MPVWCPKCHAMLPEGQEKCPVCGARVGGPGEKLFTASDIFWFSVYLIGLALIPVILAMAVGLVCSLLPR